jgi:ribosomal protein S12 methylthiotransferase accessory factor
MNDEAAVTRLASGATEGLRRLTEVVSPVGGLVGRVTRLPNNPGDPYFPVFSAHLGDLTRVVPNVKLATGGVSTVDRVDGAGGAIDAEVASRVCIAEALERYCSSVFSNEQFLWATAEELGEEALDLDELPRCSQRELADPRCPVRPPDRRAPIRWVQGYSLTRRRRVWVPAMLVYLYIHPLTSGELFTLPISTGCAGHFELAQALVNGLCEVIERDAISLTWLQRLHLPRIELDVVPDALQPYLERLRWSNVEPVLFDATTDVGIPTVYSVDLAPANQRLAQMVMCVTHVDPVSAIAKSLRESASSRIAMQTDRQAPDDVADFIDVHHGAIFMGQPERRPAFDFLLSNPRTRLLSAMPSLDAGDPVANLRVVLAAIDRAGLEAFAVELTTDECMRIGYRVVRVIVPGLQPLSFAHRAQYKAHPRLYQAPVRMGYPSHQEEELNAWPQPFA